MNEMIEGKQVSYYVTFQELQLPGEFLDILGDRTTET